MEIVSKNKPSAVLEQFKFFENFSRAMLDAYAVVDETGRVVKSNQLFAQLVGQKAKQILKTESIDELISLQIDGLPLSIKSLLTNLTPTRLDEVSGSTAEKSDLNLIIGIYPFLNSDNPDNPSCCGAFLLIRDATAEAALQGKYKDKARKSITDPLTGLFNRNHFEEYLPNQLKTLTGMQENSDQRKISVIMCDIDHFKKVNDVYGHPAGDYVIKTVAEIMQKCFRKTDVICRYGGEEFLVILPATPTEGALIASEKMRKSINENKFNFDGKIIPVSISCGVARINIGNEDGAKAIARADEALYNAKRTGRNRVCFHDGTEIKIISQGPPPLQAVS